MVRTKRRRPLTIDVAPRFTALAAVRDDLRRWLAANEVDDAVVEELVLVATELCTNAMEATPNDEPVSVEAANDGSAVRLAVSNAIDPQAPGPRSPPSLEVGSLQERGRGLSIVEAMVDSLSMTSRRGRTVVRTMRLL